jgi:hypothetical protein
MSEVERGRGVWCGVRRSGRGRMWERLIQASARSEREGWDEKEGALQSADVCRVGPVAGVTMRLAGRFATTLARPPCRLPVSRPDERVCALPAARCPLPTTAQPRMQPRLCCRCRCRCPGLGGPGVVAGRWSLVAGRWSLSLVAVAVAGAAAADAGSRPTASLPPPSSSPSPASGVGGSATKVKPRLCAAARYRCPPTHSLE